MQQNNIERLLLQEHLSQVSSPDEAAASAPVADGGLRASLLRAQIGAMESNWHNTVERAPYSNNKPFGWILVGLRKIARRLVLRQFAEDAVDQQNRYMVR